MKKIRFSLVFLIILFTFGCTRLVVLEQPKSNLMGQQVEISCFNPFSPCTLTQIGDNGLKYTSSDSKSEDIQNKTTNIEANVGATIKKELEAKLNGKYSINVKTYIKNAKIDTISDILQAPVDKPFVMEGIRADQIIVEITHKMGLNADIDAKGILSELLNVNLNQIGTSVSTNNNTKFTINNPKVYYIVTIAERDSEESELSGKGFIEAKTLSIQNPTSNRIVINNRTYWIEFYEGKINLAYTDLASPVIIKIPIEEMPANTWITGNKVVHYYADPKDQTKYHHVKLDLQAVKTGNTVNLSRVGFEVRTLILNIKDYPFWCD